MIQRITSVLLRLTGRKTVLDSQIPSGLLATFMLARGGELLRGVLRTRRLVLLGPGVRLRGRGRITFGRFISIGPECAIDGYGSAGTRLADGSRLGRGCVVTVTSHLSRLGKGFSLGANSGLGDYCHIGASGGITVGRDVIMGPFVSLHSQEHNFDRLDTPIRHQGTTEVGIAIEDDVWVGARVTILDGTKIGQGSVVAAGAVVKGVFPPNSVIAGIPARVIRSRDVGNAR
ncbi:acyltransferase [Nocardioides sp. zg-1230]|uniref:acyltransferase n=1 Tax=Nocardioides sp. zg-1230 TaxID=2736601 RepID=UPI003464BBF8